MFFFNIIFLLCKFFLFIKMSKDSSPKYYQKNKEILQENLLKYIKTFLKKKKIKSKNMVTSGIKIFLSMESKG